MSQLRGYPKSRSERELLVAGQGALVYFPQDSSTEDLHERLATSITRTNKSFPAFNVDTTRAYFHAGGKDCKWSTAFNTSMKNAVKRFGRRLRYDPVRNASRARSLTNPESLQGRQNLQVADNFGSIAGAYSYASIAS
jgi:hypothetical protein